VTWQEVAQVAPNQVQTMLRDYRDSWTSSTGRDRTRNRIRAGLYFYLTPTVAAAVFVRWPVSLLTVTPFLTALSVFTALLFGLMILVFNTAVTLKKDASIFKNAHNLTDVIGDLRATITYSIFTAVLLVIALAVGAANTIPLHPKDPHSILVLSWLWTPLFVWLAIHLLLNLAKILERIRTAFNYVTR
jgi:hypothetical protein